MEKAKKINRKGGKIRGYYKRKISFFKRKEYIKLISL